MNAEQVGELLIGVAVIGVIALLVWLLPWSTLFWVIGALVVGVIGLGLFVRRTDVKWKAHGK